jgi:hypothetical protein
MKQDSNRRITVEDLLAVKRAERPPAEFWASFESELRAKQLAAIVGKRSWRDVLPGIFSAAYRYHLPFGAVAALALTWAGIHYSRVSVVAVGNVPAAKAPSPARPLAVSPAPTQTAERSVRPQQLAQAEQPEAVRTAVVSASTLPNATSASEAPKSATGTQFSDVVAATFSGFRENKPELARSDIFSSDREFETTVESMRQAATEPLSRLDPEAEERNSRLLGTALPAYGSSSSAMLASERVRERASNDRMYESMDPYESNSRMSLEIRF